MSDAQLAEYFHAAADEEAILERRMDHNRLGFAIQLGTVRFLGTFVADPAHVPRAVVEHVAAQLGIDDLSALERYWDSQTRWDHQAEIRRRYRYQPFGQAPTHLPFLRGLFGRAWLADERPTVLCDRATAYLLEHKILLPGVTTLARLVAAVRERAKRRLWKQLAARVDRSTAKRLESLLMVPEGSSQSTLESLRRGPVRASGAGLVDAICRVEQIRELGVADFDLAGLPEAAVRRLARYTAGAGERGQLRQKYREGQEDQLSALGLVVNIVALWNTIYCQAALDRLRSAGSEVATADIARLSPLGHKHINFRGQHKVSHASTPAPGELRPATRGLTRLFVPLILTGQAVRTQSRVLVLGDSLSEFMRELGIYSTSGRGHILLRNQMRRLVSMSCSIGLRARARRTVRFLGHRRPREILVERAQARRAVAAAKARSSWARSFFKRSSATRCRWI